jgi:hypothetical protein
MWTLRVQRAASGVSLMARILHAWSLRVQEVSRCRIGLELD